MQVAVTGGTGCLGLPLVEQLVGMGISVNLLARKGDRIANGFSKQVSVITGDLKSLSQLDKLTEGCDVVFHLAGKVHEHLVTRDDDLDFYRVNVEGTNNLLKAAKENNVKRFIFFSTVGVYGKDYNFHGDETSVCKPISSYGKSKYQAEQNVLKYGSSGGLECVVLRLPLVYGPFDKGNFKKLIDVVGRRLFFYFGNGNNVRSMLSSKNAAAVAIKSAIEPLAANEVFCVTDGCDYTMTKIIDTIRDSHKLDWRPFCLPLFLAKLGGKLGDFIENVVKISLPINSAKVRKLSGNLTFSNEKAEKFLSYKPIETLEEGIDREIKWIKSIKN
jgi:nucleoside-diphosphate-sugar epimerase